ADLPLNGLPGDCLERVFSKFQLHIIEVKLLLILLDQSVLRFGKNLDECAFVELVEHATHRQTSDKLRNQSKTNEVFRLHLRQRFCVTMTARLYFGMEAK